MSTGLHRYRPEALIALESYGLRPRPATPPKLVYDHLKSLYTFEIRRMKFAWQERERRDGRQPLDDYRRGLGELKDKYHLLKMPWWAWVLDEPAIS